MTRSSRRRWPPGRRRLRLSTGRARSWLDRAPLRGKGGRGSGRHRLLDLLDGLLRGLDGLDRLLRGLLDGLDGLDRLLDGLLRWRCGRRMPGEDLLVSAPRFLTRLTPHARDQCDRDQ